MLDEQDWLCLQCGTYYYTGLYRESSSAGPQPMERKLTSLEKAGTAALSSGPVAPQIYLKHATVTLLQDSTITSKMSQV